MKNKSLLIRLIAFFFILFFLAIGGLSYSYYRNASEVIEKLTIQATQNSIEQGSQFIYSYISKLTKTTSSLSHNEALVGYLQEDNQSQQALFLMRSVLESDVDLIAATIVSDKGVLSTETDMNEMAVEDLMAESWYQQALKQSEMMPVLVPAHLKQQQDTKKWVISIAQEISDSQGNALGVLRIDIDYYRMAQYLDKLDLGKGGYIYIMDEADHFVYHPKKSVYDSQTEMKQMKQYASIQDGFSRGKKQYIYQAQVSNCHWRLIGVASMQRFHTLERQMFYTILLVAFIIFLVCLALVFSALRIWTKPLKDLQQTMLAVGDGQYHLRASQQGTKEIRDLSIQFNAMLDQIERLLQEIKENEESIRAYELKSLTAQINPHFLYNTLDTIIWMAEFNEGKKVVQLTKSLARFFRIGLNQGQETLCLEAEIDHVRQYLFIQQTRYGEKLSYHIEEAATCADFVVPKLILQPIVENAIYHGIREINRPGQINIRILDQAQFVLIEIEDNGVGFEAVKQKSQLPGSGIGLTNVDQRLRLHFGQAYHMDIQSELGVYTKVSLYLPKGQV